MSNQRTRTQGNWGAFFAVILFVGLIVLWALIPIQVIESSWQAEQNQISALSGGRSDSWIKSQAAAILADAAKDVEKAVDSLGDSQIEQWLKGRAYVTILWGSLAAYRVSELLMWSLLGIPLILAASVDGFYVREIRKTAFISQSPIRHKIGIHFFRLVSIAMVLWLFLPIPMPIIAAPAVVCFMALSLWLWVGNLQKRL